MPQMTCTKFGSDRLNGTKVEKRDGQTDRHTHRQTFILIGYLVKLKLPLYTSKNLEYLEIPEVPRLP